MSEKETTSRTDSHVHIWSRIMKFTSLDMGKKSGLHKHKINLMKGIAMPVIKARMTKNKEISL